MYYEIHGSGFPFIMIRGLSSDVYRWPPSFVEEIAKDFKVILFDNRGAGRTDKPDIEYSIRMMADDTVGLLNALNIEKAIVLGFSMGGSIAQEIVLNYPERVKKLVLCGAGSGGPHRVAASDEVYASLNSDREGLTPEETIRNSLPLLFTKNFIENNPDKIDEFVARSILAIIPPYSYRRQLTAIFNYESYSRLKNIKVPTFVISGKDDILVPPQNSELLAENIPGAKLVLLDNLAHDFFSQDPLLTAKTIIDLSK
jgi:pimeloyl-ACP methyl ester carboxylesterase